MKYNGDTIQVVWLDLDDTLIDFEANSRRALARLYAIEHLGLLWPTAEAWTECYEKYNKDLWTEYNLGRISRDHLRMERFRLPLVEAGMPHAEATEASTRFDPAYLDYLAAEKQLVPGALHLLKALRQAGVTTGVLSNGFKEVQHRKIKSAGLDTLIDIVVLSDDIGVNKPDIRLFNHAMQRAGITRREAHLMIGDNPATDIAGAIAAGWHTIAFDRRQIVPVRQQGDYISVSHLALIEAQCGLKQL